MMIVRRLALTVEQGLATRSNENPLYICKPWHPAQTLKYLFLLHFIKVTASIYQFHVKRFDDELVVARRAAPRAITRQIVPTLNLLGQAIGESAWLGARNSALHPLRLPAGSRPFECGL